MRKIVFDFNMLISAIVFLSSLIFLMYLIRKEKNIFLNSKFLLLIFITISFLGILINQTPSDAYLPIIFPFVIFSLSIFLNQLLNLRRIKYIAVASIFILLSFNFYSAYKNTFKPDLVDRIKASDKVIALTKGQQYNLIGKGEGSWFESFTMNYEYLLWWKGYPPSDKKVKLKIIIKEENTGISVYKL